MTYNVLGAQADGNVFSEHAGMAARIDQVQPDVVVLQEVQSDDVVALLTQTTTPYRLASYLKWECDVKSDQEGVAILVRSAISVTTAGRRHVGSTCANPTVKRVLVWADLDLPGGPLRVYGTHLTAGSGDSTSSRNAQIRQIRAVIEADDPDGRGRWLFTGDMNTTPGASGYRLITVGEPGADAIRMVDTFAEVSPAALDPTTCPTIASSDAAGLAGLLANPAAVRACGYTAGWPKDDNFLGCDVLSLCNSWQLRRDQPVRERIDNVFRAVDGPVTVLDTFVPNRSDADWASPGSEWFRLSDHLPYVADLAIAAD